MRLRQIFAGPAIRRLCVLILLTAGGAAGPLWAQDGAISTGFRLTAPYVMQAADGSLSGLEYELVMAAAQRGGLMLKPEITLMGRLPEDFRRQSFGAIVPANPAMRLPGCMSDTVLVYRNAAFTLAPRGLVLARIDDLARHDVMAFQNAHIILGPEMTAVRQGNPNYREVANQMLQVRALFSARTDAIVIERRIFLHLARSPETGLDTGTPVTEHALFAPISYGIAFQRPEHCLAFNRGLEMLKRDGDYDAILSRWDRPLQARQGGLPGGRPPG